MTIVKPMIKYISQEKHKIKIEFLRKFSRGATLFYMTAPLTNGSALPIYLPILEL